MYSIDEVIATNITCTCPHDEIGQRGPGAAIGDMHQIDAGQHLEKFARHLIGRTGATRCHGDPIRIGLGIGDELGDRLRRKRRVDHHHVGHARDARDRRDVADEVVAELVVERRVDRVRRAHHDERVAVGSGIHHRLGGDIGSGPRPVLDHELLA
jgi:hypothetical protein